MDHKESMAMTPPGEKLVTSWRRSPTASILKGLEEKKITTTPREHFSEDYIYKWKSPPRTASGSKQLRLAQTIQFMVSPAFRMQIPTKRSYQIGKTIHAAHCRF